MGNFNRDNKFNRGGGRDFNRGGFNRGGGRPVEMHKAVCSNCGNECEVPFRPTSGKPVFCSNCFDRNRSTDSRDSGVPREWNSNRSEDRQMFDAVCDNCGKDCKVPFQPRSGKPIYCSNCFEEKGNALGDGPRNSSQSNQNGAQFAEVNTKLDRILSLLSKQERVAVVPVVQAEEKVEKFEKKAKAAKAPKETPASVIE